MGLKAWFNANVVDTQDTLLYGDVVPSDSQPGKNLGLHLVMSRAKFGHLVKSAFNMTYMSGKEKQKGQGDTAATVSAFFGLPSSEPSNVRHLLKTMAGWDDGFSPSQNLLKGIPNFTKSFVGVVLQTTLNTLKLVTEFAPLAIKNIVNKGIFKLWNYEIEGDFAPVLVVSDSLPTAKPAEGDRELTPSRTISGEALLNNAKRVGKYVLKGLGLIALGILYTPFKIWHLVGRAITSPINSMEAAFRSGEMLLTSFESQSDLDGVSPAEKNARIVFGRIFGGIAALLSLAITGTAYVVIATFLLPLILAGVATGMTSAATAVLSPAAVAWLSGAVASVTSAFTSVGTAVVSALGLGAVAEAAGVGVVAVGAAVLASSVVTGSTMVGGVVDAVGNTVEDQQLPKGRGVTNDNQQTFVNKKGIPRSALYLAASKNVASTNVFFEDSALDGGERNDEGALTTPTPTPTPVTIGGGA